MYLTCPHLLLVHIVVAEYKVVRCQVNCPDKDCAILCAGDFLDLHEGMRDRGPRQKRRYL
jgi:hypothetical protein